jgi:hypothetical protein
MAKVKSSKFSKVLKDIRSSNEQTDTGISELRRDVNDLENTVLLIMEKIRRIEKYPVVQTKKGKLIPTKLDVDTSDIPANDPFVSSDINNETSKNILLKMYNFMVRNSENQKNKEDKERKDRQSREKKREVDYRKELIKAGLDPKLLKKKKGLLGKMATGIKFGSFLAIGAGIAGLVWLFKDEIVNSSKLIGDSIKEFGTFISQKFQKIVDIIQPILKFITDNPLFKMVQEKFDNITGQIKNSGGSILDTVISEVKNMITSVYESITGWLMNIFDPVTKFLSDPSMSWDQFKTVLKSVAFAIAGGPKRFASIETAVDNAESVRLKTVYGDEYYNKTKDIVDMFSDDEDLKKLFNQEFGGRYRDFFVGKLDRRELTNAIVRDHLEQNLLKSVRDDSTEYYGKDDPKQKRRLDVLKQLNERDNKFLQDLQAIADEMFPDKGYKADRYDSRNEKTGEVTSGFAIVRPDGTPVLNLDSDYMEMLRHKGKLALKSYVKTELMKSVEYIKGTELYKVGEQTVEQGKDLYTKSKEEGEKLLGKVENTMGSVAAEVGEPYSGVSTPEQAMVATGNLVSKATDAVTENVVKPLTEKTSKFTADDLFSVANKSYDVMQKGIGEVIGVAGKFGNWDEASKFIGGFTGPQKVEENLTPEQRRTEVSQDPNEDPFHLQTMFDQSKERIAPVNKIVNNKGSTSSTDNFAFPPVRNSDPSKKWCVIDSLCKP